MSSWHNHTSSALICNPEPYDVYVPSRMSYVGRDTWTFTSLEGESVEVGDVLLLNVWFIDGSPYKHEMGIIRKQQRWE